MSTESPRRHPETRSSGLTRSASVWVHRHTDELTPLVEADEPFRFAELDEDISMSLRRKASECDVILQVERKRSKEQWFHTWRVHPRAREIVENIERENTLPCGHRVNFENTSEGYECTICGAIHSREDLEAVL